MQEVETEDSLANTSNDIHILVVNLSLKVQNVLFIIIKYTTLHKSRKLFLFKGYLPLCYYFIKKYLFLRK